MDDIKDFRLENMDDSKYVRPMRIRYKQDGKEKIWDLILCHSGVYIIVHNVSRDKLIFVKQFRPAVYFCALKRKLQGEVKAGDVLDTSVLPGSEGVTIELCAGIVDKTKSVLEIARDEVKEECGYDVPKEKIQQIQSCFAAVGTGGEMCHMFYAEVTDAMKTSSGGGVEEEGELIEVIEMSVQEVKEFLKKKELNTSPATIYGIMWFLLNKAK